MVWPADFSVPLMAMSSDSAGVLHVLSCASDLEDLVSAMLHPLCAPESSSSLAVLRKLIFFVLSVVSKKTAYVVFASSVELAGAVNVLTASFENDDGLVSV